MLLMRLPFFVVVAALFSIAASSVIYDDDEYADPNDVESWSNNLPEDDSEVHNYAGIIYYTYKSEELAIFSKKSSDNSSKNQLYSCIKFNKDHSCTSPVLKWAKLNGDDHDIRRVEISAASVYNFSLNYLLDIKVYQTPWTAVLVPAGDHLKVEFTRSHPLSYLNQSVVRQRVYYFEDQEDMCADYRPNATEGLTGINSMRTAFYYRFKGIDYVTFAYFFIKKANNICMYRFKVNDITGKENASLEIDAFNFTSSYPTDNYAPHFFAFDTNFGAFVSLYWNGIRGNLPEAHFYVFHENEPERIDFTLSYPLQNFDPDVLEEIFKGDYGPEAYPAFVALGLQVFISFTPKGADREFSGLWKDKTEHFIFRRPLDNYQSLLRLRKDYIQKTQAEKPFNASFEHDPNSTNQVYIPQHTFTTIAIPYAADPDKNDAASADDKESKQDDEGCSGDPLLWLLILFVILDIVLIILLIILITLSILGAKKRKAKQPVMQKKSKRDPSKVVAPKTPKHMTPTTESKKTKKKGKPEKKNEIPDAEKNCTVKDKKKATTIDEGTQFYTVDATFDHTVEKKK